MHLETFLPYRLAHIAALVSRALHEQYNRVHALTVPEWRVLMTLGEFDTMTAKEIGRHSSLHKTKISRAVRALEQRGWLRRQENSDDRREEYLSLTVKGKKIYRQVIPLALQFQTRLLAILGRESEKFAKLLGKLEKTV